MPKSNTTDYDPRYQRAQTLDGAKARYVSDSDYDIDDYEDDLDRLMEQGRYPDRQQMLEEPLHQLGIK